MWSKEKKKRQSSRRNPWHAEDLRVRLSSSLRRYPSNALNARARGDKASDRARRKDRRGRDSHRKKRKHQPSLALSSGQGVTILRADISERVASTRCRAGIRKGRGKGNRASMKGARSEKREEKDVPLNACLRWKQLALSRTGFANQMTARAGKRREGKEEEPLFRRAYAEYEGGRSSALGKLQNSAETLPIFLTSTRDKMEEANRNFPGAVRYTLKAPARYLPKPCRPGDKPRTTQKRIEGGKEDKRPRAQTERAGRGEL